MQQIGTFWIEMSIFESAPSGKFLSNYLFRALWIAADFMVLVPSSPIGFFEVEIPKKVLHIFRKKNKKVKKIEIFEKMINF